MGGFFSGPVVEVTNTDTFNASASYGNSTTHEIEDPRSPTAEVKRTPLNNIIQNTESTTPNASHETPILKKDAATLRNKLLKKMHNFSSKENKTE
ncbi:Hypothetical protein SRAE_2000145300 [Strongyloides ratti]|uniref:Uncharacterized protein n=1 Tax=Strongyloides ratti TaxID=34506 RepID=A0A090LAL5_STRRB|nr:Hypothetical protein SRAE_2000145300 [Strongyloides ratti]CEF66787.1 Hypothetical protein SRAE_2000145300 [Strongyloides ratti]